jgi:hypothetical protein
MRSRRTAVVLASTGLLSAAFGAGAAQALPPTKTGWWNAASAGGAALPMPTTTAGDLHIGQAPNGPSAYAAVSYDLLGQAATSASLTLKLKSALGTPALSACITKDNSWKAAQDGALADAPAFDCAKAGISGVLSAAGDSITFLLNDTQQLAGSYSLAIVPTPGAVPFQVDVEKPGPTSLTPTGLTAAPDAPAPYQPPPPAGAAPGGGAAAPAPMPAGLAPIAPAPAAAQAPLVAPPAAPAPQPAAAPPALPPAVATAPIQPVSNRERYAAGSLLALIAGGLVWAFQQPGTTPRLIGGLARGEGSVPPPVGAVRRGIGRFATLRTAPARRLV